MQLLLCSLAISAPLINALNSLFALLLHDTKVYDKTVLVIPKPGHQKSLNYEIQKVLQPFSYNLWVVLVAVTITAALLSVWFSDREELLSKQRYGKKIKLKQKNQPKKKKRTGAYIRLILDSMLEKGMFFFSAGVDQDSNASLPHKTLMFGFGFFILIAVSAYVANLAAFLTQNGLQTNIATMEEVVDSGGNILIVTFFVGLVVSFYLTMLFLFFVDSRNLWSSRFGERGSNQVARGEVVVSH